MFTLTLGFIVKLPGLWGSFRVLMKGEKGYIKKP